MKSYLYYINGGLETRQKISAVQIENCQLSDTIEKLY